jgi:hypothetical protein
MFYPDRIKMRRRLIGIERTRKKPRTIAGFLPNKERGKLVTGRTLGKG